MPASISAFLGVRAAGLRLRRSASGSALGTSPQYSSTTTNRTRRCNGRRHEARRTRAEVGAQCRFSNSPCAPHLAPARAPVIVCLLGPLVLVFGSEGDFARRSDALDATRVQPAAVSAATTFLSRVAPWALFRRMTRHFLCGVAASRRRIATTLGARWRVRATAATASSPAQSSHWHVCIGRSLAARSPSTSLRRAAAASRRFDGQRRRRGASLANRGRGNLARRLPRTRGSAAVRPEVETSSGPRAELGRSFDVVVQSSYSTGGRLAANELETNEG